MQMEKLYAFICVLFISALTVLEPSTAFSRTKEQKITLPNHDKIIFTASGSTVTVLSPEGNHPQSVPGNTLAPELVGSLITAINNCSNNAVASLIASFAPFPADNALGLIKRRQREAEEWQGIY